MKAKFVKRVKLKIKTVCFESKKKLMTKTNYTIIVILGPLCNEWTFWAC